MNLYHAVVICIVSCLYCDTAAAGWAPNCCLKTSNQKVPAKNFVYYTVHKAGLCPINAVAFWTKRGRKLCYDPDLDWVQSAMKTIGPRSSAPGTSTEGKAKRKGKGKKQKKKQQ